MMKKSHVLLALLIALCLTVLNGCGAPTTTELTESEAYFTVDACSITGSVESGVLSMEAVYTVTNNAEEAVAEITLLTPHLDGSEMKDLQLTMGDKTYPLTVKDKDVIALDTALQPGEQTDLLIQYHIDGLAMPNGGEETWRITVPTLDKSATSTGIGEVLVEISFDEPVVLKTSLPIGLEQDGDTKIVGALGNLVNLLVLELK